jgi:hypothetical protein
MKCNTKRHMLSCWLPVFVLADCGEYYVLTNTTPSLDGDRHKSPAELVLASIRWNFICFLFLNQLYDSPLNMLYFGESVIRAYKTMSFFELVGRVLSVWILMKGHPLFTSVFLYSCASIQQREDPVVGCEWLTCHGSVRPTSLQATTSHLSVPPEKYFSSEVRRSLSSYSWSMIPPFIIT